ncbi:hypothetical protein PHLGIDRAFT_123988 [Phlebiopsis gigantea 11061_1 CR5-6]|uniref:N-alpha-acetyltransferase 40 n=1 Tax=Phlebiopsis gigantea (strain 11061_1 CR5-6) TaxID=745531 RepID=A0A0C3P3E5_PHLG1|nr:hypothetical protein PHLGIDRAFT_123988 [Phlebiopsis gigantea 11061_1 CR5-6]
MATLHERPVAVRKASQATSVQLAEDLPSSLTREAHTFTVNLLHSSELSESWKDAIWDIIEDNMEEMCAKSSVGWEPREKAKELFHADVRFIILSIPAVPASDLKTEDSDVVVGFSVFKFGYEEGETLLSCYDIQLAGDFQKLGLEEFLACEMLDLGTRWNMEKVMLTVLKVNSSADQFYRRLGFTLDASSPDFVREDGDDDDAGHCDYEILSFML